MKHCMSDCRVNLDNNGAYGCRNWSEDQVKGGQYLTNFDNSKQNYVYYVSLIPQTLYVHDDDVAW